MGKKTQPVVFEILQEKEPEIISTMGEVKMILGSYLLSPFTSQTNNSIEVLEPLPLKFPKDKYLTVQEAKKRTGISTPKLRQMCKEQVIDCSKSGKFWMIPLKSLKIYKKNRKK